MKYLSVQEVADRLSVSSATVARWAASGKLPSSRAGKLTRISESDLQAFYDQNKRGR